jgi:hypothetical protein
MKTTTERNKISHTNVNAIKSVVFNQANTILGKLGPRHGILSHSWKVV